MHRGGEAKRNGRDRSRRQHRGAGAISGLLAPGAGVIFKDRGGWQVSAIAVRANTYCDIKVQFPDAADAVFAVDAFGSPYSALVG